MARAEPGGFLQGSYGAHVKRAAQTMLGNAGP